MHTPVKPSFYVACRDFGLLDRIVLIEMNFKPVRACGIVADPAGFVGGNAVDGISRGYVL
ncbi:hypothetical protein ACFQI7_16765 [Paenibacillus allorhizosphaerae]|uniref:hypothetical protein n=1 Tax=Paenibacillus allorhizosphaerae TaxID=2849866 RepID=UPI0036115F75